MKNETCKEFINKLASKEPIPGGGSATALVGAISAALGCMATNLTIGKKRYKNIEEEMILVQNKLIKLQQELLDCMKKDTENFMPLYNAYSLPQQTIEEKEKKDLILEEALIKAIEIPLKLIELCEQVIDINIFLFKNGSKNVASDAICGITLAESSLKCASYNILVNTKLMKNREVAEKYNKKIDKIVKSNIEKVEKIEPEIKQYFIKK